MLLLFLEGFPNLYFVCVDVLPAEAVALPPQQLEGLKVVSCHVGAVQLEEQPVLSTDEPSPAAHFFSFYIFISMYMCVWMECIHRHDIACLWKSKGNLQELILSSGFRHPTQVVMLAFALLCHSASLFLLFFF